jgi:hypothetical protein
MQPGGPGRREFSPVASSLSVGCVRAAAKLAMLALRRGMKGTPWRVHIRLMLPAES